MLSVENPTVRIRILKKTRESLRLKDLLRTKQWSKQRTPMENAQGIYVNIPDEKRRESIQKYKGNYQMMNENKSLENFEMKHNLSFWNKLSHLQSRDPKYIRCWNKD